MNHKIVLSVHATAEKKIGEVVRITPDAAAAIEQLMLETGLSARTIASELIIQAAQIVEIRKV